MDIIKKTWYFRTVRARITFSFAVLLLMVHLLALLIMDTVLSYSNEVLPLNVESSLGGESLNKSFQEFLNESSKRIEACFFKEIYVGERLLSTL